MNGNDFETSRKALEAKRKDLRRQGKGEKLNAAEALTEGEENVLVSWVILTRQCSFTPCGTCAPCTLAGGGWMNIGG